MPITDHSTRDLGDPNLVKACLAEEFTTPLSMHNFSLDLALREVNRVKAVKATKFKGYKGHTVISFWEKKITTTDSAIFSSSSCAYA